MSNRLLLFLILINFFKNTKLIKYLKQCFPGKITVRIFVVIFSKMSKKNLFNSIFIHSQKMSLQRALKIKGYNVA